MAPIIRPLQKKFYKKYSYKITFCNSFPNTIPTSLKDLLQKKGNAPTTAKNYVCVHIKPKYDIRERSEGYIEGHCGLSYGTSPDWLDLGSTNARFGRYSVFLKNEEEFNKVCDDLNDIVYEITKPLNQNHAKTLDEDYTAIVREKLFFGKFRYKIKFDFIRNVKQEKEIRDKARNILKQNNLIVSGSDYRSDWVDKGKGVRDIWSSMRYVMVNDPRVAMMFKLSFDKEIKGIDKIILTSEV